jgi:hypothetical protein
MALFTSFSYEYTAYGGLFLLVWIVLYPLFFSWSRNIPGPVLARYTRFWYVWNVFNYKFHLTNKRIHKKYGISIFAQIWEMIPFFVNKLRENRTGDAGILQYRRPNNT